MRAVNSATPKTLRLLLARPHLLREAKIMEAVIEQAIGGLIAIS
jgi:hypothetical protein